MRDKETMRTEAAHYRALAEQLKLDYENLDDETLRDTLEGLSDLPQMIEEIVRSSLQDDVLIVALKTRLDEMSARLTRFKVRFEKKRELACWAMGSAGIDKLEVPDFSASLRQGGVKLEVTDESKLPSTYFVPQPAKLDRNGLLVALKQGVAVEGAVLAFGSPHIAVRTR